MYHLYNTWCEGLLARQKYRSLPEELDDDCIDFSTNDYLGLRYAKELIEAAVYAGTQFGVGTGGSRLLAGNNGIFKEFEKQIALSKGTEASLVFNSGFQANISVLSTLLDASVLGNKPIVFLDRLNHASLYQAVMLSKAEMARFRHIDMDHLHSLLEKYKTDPRPKFIISETVFGMEGDVVPIDILFKLSKKYKVFLYLDEAHATGMMGPLGYGLSTLVPIQEIPHLIMGTFSKALGCFGAYIACSKVVKEYLINKRPGFVYSTSLSPMVIGAAAKSWELVPKLDYKRKFLNINAIDVRGRLQKMGFDIAHSTTHIIPLVFGKEEMVMQAKAKLLKLGIAVSAVRPPTVPPGTSRLRIALNTKHAQKDYEHLLWALQQL